MSNTKGNTNSYSWLWLIPAFLLVAVLVLLFFLYLVRMVDSAVEVTPTLTPTLTPLVTPIQVSNTIVTPMVLLPYTATVREKLAVRGGPGEEFFRIRYLDPGAVVDVLELLPAADGGTWARIADREYVNSKYLSKK